MKKRIIRIISVLAIVATALVAFSCHWRISNIKLPATISANSTFNVDITTNIQTPETDYVSKMVVMFCVPKSWNAQQTAKVSFSTNGFPAAMKEKDAKYDDLTEYDHEEMIPVTKDDIEGLTGKPFPEAFYQTYGDGGNFGDVEWIGFITKDAKTVTDISANATNNTFDIIVHATFATDDINYKFFLNFWAGSANANCGLGYPWGENFGAYNTGVEKAVVQVTGGSEKANYTVPKMVSTVPVEFRYGDIFNVILTADLEGAESALKGKDEVYLCGEALLADGTTVTVDQPKPKNLMKRNGNQYSKYILPSLFFGIDYSKKIEALHVWFCDKDGAIIEKCGEEAGWELTQAENE